ncbi:MAG TPA: O-antigen ligase family protein, partial [Nitrospirota bacterium]
FVAPALLVALSFLIYNHPWTRGRAKVLFFAFCAAAFFAIVMTGSRGGALSFAVGLFVLVWIRSKKVALITAALLLALLALIQNPIKERVINTEPYSYSRVDIWKSAGRMLLDHPQGVGLGNFKFYWTEYNFPVDGAIVRYGKKAATAHGEYQHFGAEMGFLGIAAILFGLFLLLRACRNSIKVSVSRGDPAAAAGVSAGIITVLVHAAVDANLHEPGIVFLFIMLVVIMLQAGEDGRDIRADLGQSRPMFAAASLGWVFLMLVWAAVPAIGYYCGTKADAAMKAGNAGEAVKFLDIAQRVEPGNAEIYNRRAALYFRQSAGDPKAFEKAVTELGKAAKCNPVERSYPAISAQIELSAASGKASPDRQLLLSALKDSEYASRLDPFGWDIMLNRARVLVLLGDTDNAIKALERLKSVEPDCLEGRRLLAVLYKKTGQKDLSAEECRIIIESFEKYSKGAVMPQERQFLSVDISAVRALSAELKKG